MLIPLQRATSLPHLNPDWLNFLVPAYPGCPGKENVKQTGVLVVIVIVIIIIIIFDPGTQFPENEKNTLCNTKKYKNQAGMKLLLLLHKTVMQ